MSDASDLRQDLAALVRELLEESPRAGNPIGEPIREHLGVPVEELTLHAEELSDFELPNLQLGLDAMLARRGWQGQILGLQESGATSPTSVSVT